jgi:phospholipid/cholesterol/gamma-HCH transport system substrate-binding protein
LFDYTKPQMIVGTFLLVGLALLGYLSVSIGGLRLRREDNYRVLARFSNVGDLKVDAPVKVAGVTTGKVRSIRLVDYFAECELAVDRTFALPKDTIASITTSGLLGESYVSLSPGAAEGNLADGDRITHTEPALNIADVLGRYAFGSSNKSGETENSGGDPPLGVPATSPRKEGTRER